MAAAGLFGAGSAPLVLEREGGANDQLDFKAKQSYTRNKHDFVVGLLISDGLGGGHRASRSGEVTEGEECSKSRDDALVPVESQQRHRERRAE